MKSVSYLRNMASTARLGFSEEARKGGEVGLKTRAPVQFVTKKKKN